MRHLGAPWWVVAAAIGLASYLVAVTLMLVWYTSADYSSGFRDLLRQIALFAGLALCLPTLLLVILLFVRRIARPVAVSAVAWMAFSAFLLFPVQPVLAVWAAVVALVVFGATVAGWRRSGRDLAWPESNGPTPIQ